MTVSDLRAIHPRMPSIADLDWTKFAFAYDRPSDTFYWDFYGEPRAAVSVPVSDHVLYSVDPETEEVVGYQIDGFLACAVYEMPLFLEIADLIGLEPAEVEAIRAKLKPEARERSAMHALLGSLAAAEPIRGDAERPAMFVPLPAPSARPPANRSPGRPPATVPAPDTRARQCPT